MYGDSKKKRVKEVSEIPPPGIKESIQHSSVILLLIRT
jgi:hypothetical protein